MIPPSFEYLAPKTILDAVALLQKHGDEAKILAGGHSLIPAMRLRLAEPGYLIDISGIGVWITSKKNPDNLGLEP